MESTKTSTENESRSGSSGMLPICDVCGQVVTPEDCYETELTASGATCPTAMSLHQACYEAASAIWVPEDPESTCNVDPLYPETAQWTYPPPAAEAE
ncbi:MAG: hypothetical protein ACRD12_05205 [Acidimicrobiales bacterium]